MMENLWVATMNRGKMSEFKLLFGEALPALTLHPASELAVYAAPPENGKTFLENARIKARALRSIKNADWVMAEDSGLEVTALGNLPGIHSARYAGPKASDSENVAKMIKMLQMKGATDRSAQFVCELVVLTPDNQEWNFTGRFAGTISKVPRGLNGFGYDPIFVPENQTQSLAELGPGYKNQHSHRAQACRAFIARLKS